MNLAEARELESRYGRADAELRPFELDNLDRLSVDEVTALLQQRFRRFLASGCDHRRALLLAVGLT
jgi:hypothetical protein